MTQSVQKAVSYAAVQEPYDAKLLTQKVVAYAAVMIPQDAALRAQKAVAYAGVQADASGDARQDASANRPAYRAGPDPYVEFGAGDSLDVSIIFSGLYTLLTYRPDDTFTVQTVTLPAGPYTLPSVNFNQAVLIRGGLSTIAIESIKLSMRTRAGNA